MIFFLLFNPKFFALFCLCRNRDRSHTVAAPPSSSALSSSSSLPSLSQTSSGSEIRTWRQRRPTQSSLQPVSSSSSLSSSSSPSSSSSSLFPPRVGATSSTTAANTQGGAKEEAVKQGYLYSLSARFVISSPLRLFSSSHSSHLPPHILLFFVVLAFHSCFFSCVARELEEHF